MNDLQAIRFDGTISCRYCAALVLDENQQRHLAWHEATASRLKGRTT